MVRLHTQFSDEGDYDTEQPKSGWSDVSAIAYLSLGGKGEFILAMVSSSNMRCRGWLRRGTEEEF